MATQDLKFTPGVDLTQSLDWTDSDSNPVDATVYDFTFQFRRLGDNAETTAVADWSEYVSGALGKITISVPAKETKLIKSGRFYYSVIASTDLGSTTELLQGYLVTDQVGAVFSG